MMKMGKLIGRLAVATVLVGISVLSTAALAFPAQLEAGTISTGSGLHKGDGEVASYLLSCPQDVDGSGSIDVLDISLVASNWNTALGDPGYDPVYDVAVPLDNRVDIRDVQAVSAAYGQTCAAAAQRYRLWDETQGNASQIVWRPGGDVELHTREGVVRTAAPTQPQAGTISTGSGVQVWNGHNCPANVPVNIAGLSAGLGGYETKVGWDPARFSSADADIAININPYLTNGGTRQQSGDSSTPALKAVSSGAVKYGAYSWGAGDPPGNQANGQLSTVSIKPTATCGSAALTVADTQLVDINDSLIPLTAQSGSSVAVFSRYDASGSGALINSSDVSAVVAKLNQTVGANCGPNYRYDTSVGDPLINSSDVNAIVAKLNQSVNTACVD